MTNQWIDVAMPLDGWLPGILLAIALLGLRYLLFAGGALLFLAISRRSVEARRIQPVRFSRAQLVREALWSCSSIVVFALVIVLTVYLDRRFGVMQLYTGIDGPGWIWFWLSIPVAILMHDLYFYASHRFMHLPGVYERVHRVHHLSTNPSPLAAFAFHPVEALIEIAGVVLIAIILPMHTAAFAVFTLIVLVTNVLGHLGHELFPPGFERSALGRVVNTATSHNQHHRTFAYNFGLYTLVWDRLFGTVHPGYGRLFARVAGEKTSESSPSEA